MQSEKRKEKREVEAIVRKLDVNFELEFATLWDLYTMWTGKHSKHTLVSSSENLQRLIQISKWTIPRNQSTWETLLCGGHTLHHYIVVKVDSLINHCNNEIENCKESEPERAQGFQEVKEEFQKIKDEAEEQGKVAYLNLDGQSRIDQPITKFFENKFPLNMKEVRKWNDKETDLEFFRMEAGKNYLFKDLPELVKQDIKNVKVCCAISNEGTFEIYKQMVIGVNSTDPWSFFQKVYLGPSLLKARMMTILNDPAIKAMFRFNPKLFTGNTYGIEIYGDRRFLMELCLFTAPDHKEWPEDKDLETYSGEFNKERIPPKSHFVNVKKWLSDFAKILGYGFTNKKPLDNLNTLSGLNVLKSYCLLMKCITYGNKLSRENQFDKYKILDKRIWINDFIEDEAARMSNFEDAYFGPVSNFQSSKCTQKKMKKLSGNFAGRKYSIDDYGVHEYTKNDDSYSATYRNNKISYMKTRIRYLKAKLDERLQDYLDRNIIVLKVDSGAVSKNQKRDALVTSDFIDGIGGEKLTPRQAFSSDTETHHMKKVEYGGETELSNLTPTLKEHNRSLG